MSNPPKRGRDDAEASAGGNNPEASHKGNGATRQNRYSRSKPDARQQAVNDAHESLQSLLNPQTSDGHPRVISSSGITHRSHGRVVGPAAEHHQLAGPVSRPPAGRVALGHGTEGRPARTSLPALRAIPNISVQDPEETPAAPDTRLGTYAARANAGLAAARKHAGTFLDESGQAEPAAPAPPARTASHWVSRHATFLVILAIVAVVGIAGGARFFSAHSAVGHDLSATQDFTGNDADETGYSDTKQSADSSDFQLALPRTQAITNGNTAPGSAPAMPPDVTRYTVAQGDTLQSIADKFNVLPETVMGSNGIFDSQEILVPGRVLVVPPVDGMYYVAKKGDTVETVAQRFQVMPDVVLSYPRNVVNADGTIKEGQALVVPGGMVPERDTVITYRVRRGDTLKGIAARFQVDVPTMIYSNKIPDPDNLQPGSELRVLPIPGVEYKVKKGDTVNAIADRMGVTPQMILDYQPNHLAVGSTLKIDQVILVPGGDPTLAVASSNSSSSNNSSKSSSKSSSSDSNNQPAVAAARIQPDSRSSVRPGQDPKGTNKGDGGSVAPKTDNSVSPPSVKEPPPPKQQPPPAPTKKPQPKATAAPKNNPSSPKVGTGHLIWPVSATITQYFSRAHNGLDLATSAGTPIHAADSGRVVWSGWRTDGLGYCVIIDHLDGITTVYGHQIRQPAVYVGQYVTRGQVIGWVGSTGHSTGPHVHFMVKIGGASSRNYANPLAYLP